MDFNRLLCIILFLLQILIITGYFIFKEYSRYIQREAKKEEFRERELRIEEFKIFSELSPEIAEKELDSLVDKYMNDFVLDNIVINNIDYIKKDDIDYMVKHITRSITIEISELYLFYIKILVNIRNDEDLIKFIHKKVKQHVLKFVTEFNSAR